MDDDSHFQTGIAGVSFAGKEGKEKREKKEKRKEKREKRKEKREKRKEKREKKEEKRKKKVISFNIFYFMTSQTSWILQERDPRNLESNFVQRNPPPQETRIKEESKRNQRKERRKEKRKKERKKERKKRMAPHQMQQIPIQERNSHSSLAKSVSKIKKEEDGNQEGGMGGQE